MPPIVNLKFKGNKSFVAFSNLSDTESLTKTWKVCTKVASYLEQGQRLENLSWRLWHLQNLMVDTDNAKSKREFKKLSKNMGDKLDKEKGRAIESLEAPDFKRNASTDLIRQRAVERERSREASQNARPGTIKRMQFTFSVDTPPGSFPTTSSSSYTFAGEGSATAPTKPDLRPSAEFREGRRRKRGDPRSNGPSDSPYNLGSTSNIDGSSQAAFFESSSEKFIGSYEKLHFPALFSSSFGPTALLYSTPSLTNPMSYGEGVSGGCATGFSIMRPTIELPLDELLEAQEAEERMAEAYARANIDDMKEDGNDDVDMPYDNGNFPLCESTSTATIPAADHPQDILMSDSRQHQHLPTSTPCSDPNANNTSSDSFTHVHSQSQHAHQQSHPRTRAKDRSGKNTPTNRPVLTVQTSSSTKKTGKGRRASVAGVKSPSSSVTPAPSASVVKNSIVTCTGTTTAVKSATATTLNPSLLLGNASVQGSGGKTMLTAPGGVKAECSNCGATHTPLWRRGLNDELNCNACGLYCKLHKRPRPKSMRASHGEARRGGASSLPSSLSSAAAPPVLSPVVPAGEVTNANAEMASLGMTVSSGRGDVVDIVGSAQCYNCHTTATPLWRKDDEGKTVCNACGLYYKLHGSARPISMKSDIIRKRSRHDARAPRSSLAEATSASNTPGTPSEPPSQTQTPSASPNASRRPTPSPSPILAPDSTTQPVAVTSHAMSAGIGSSAGMVGTGIGVGGSSELMGALGDTYAVYNPFPGPYHPDYLSQNWVQPGMASAGANDALPFAGVDTLDGESASSSDASQMDKSANTNTSGHGSGNSNGNTNPTMTGRTAKRRRMSTDSVSEPPSSAVSYSSYGGDSFTASTGPTSASSSSRRSSMDFPFFSPYTVFRGNGNNAFWHHSSGSGVERSPQFIHPPMLPDGVGASASDGRGHGHGHSHSRLGHGGMDFLHPPMMLPQEEDSLFAAFLHPPMILPQDGEQIQHGYEYGQGEYYETGMQQY